MPGLAPAQALLLAGPGRYLYGAEAWPWPPPLRCGTGRCSAPLPPRTPPTNSLRLRQGDPSALDECDQHGRIRGARPDQVVDQAVRAYVASYLDGQSVQLMAADWARCRELSARIRDDLIHLGLVDGRRTARKVGLRSGSASLYAGERGVPGCPGVTVSSRGCPADRARNGHGMCG
jgi:hypothetical protein